MEPSTSAKSRVYPVYAAMVVVLVAASKTASAQNAVESAETARRAWADMSSAFRAGNLDEAAAAIDRSVDAWPTQVAYQRVKALLAARRSDTLALIEAIEALTAMESHGGIMADSAVEAMRATPGVNAALSRLEGASAPILAGAVRATIPDSVFYAEGVDADPESESVFASSIRYGTILEIRRDGSMRDLEVNRADGASSIMGVRVDPSGEFLWATTSTLPQFVHYDADAPYVAALLKIRVTDGEVVDRIDLNVEGERPILGDLAIDPNGAVFVTDSRVPRIVRFNPATRDLEEIRDPLFRSLQGIAPAADGRHVFVADYSHGLLRLDLSNGNVTRLRDAPGTTSLGLDGISLYHDDVIAVQNGTVPPRVVRFDVNEGGDSIVSATVIDRHLPLADEPTIGTILGDTFVYVANSQWEKYDDYGNRRPETHLAPTVLLGVNLQP